MDVFVGLLLRANTQFRLQHLSRYTNANKKTLLIKITAYLLVSLHIIKLGFGRKEITHHVNRNSSLVSKTANKLSKSWVTSFPVISSIVIELTPSIVDLYKCKDYDAYTDHF